MPNAVVLLATVPFVNPWLLGGLGLIALPVIIHLLSRRQFRIVPWAAMRFVLDAERRNRRRSRFEQWLLLALRCLAMALLALLVARPFIEPGVLASLIGDRGATQRLIVLDDSFSLGYRQGAAQDFSLLRDAADRLLAWLRQAASADRVTVMLTSSPETPLVEDLAVSSAGYEDLRAKVRELKPGVIAATPRSLIERIAARLEAEQRRGAADLILFSDFQRSEWVAKEHAESIFAPLMRGDLGETRVVFVATGAAPRPNLAVTDLRLERPQTVAGMPAIALATIANYATTPARQLSLRLSIGGATNPPTQVDEIGAGQSKVVSAEVTFPDEGVVELAASVDATDGASPDDARRIAVHVQRSIAALLVNGQPAADPARDEVFYLRSALTPSGPYASGVSVETIDPAALTSTTINQYQCVMLCNVPPPNDAMVEWLERYVSQGGGLAIFLGDNVGEAAAYNATLYKSGAGLLPAELGEVQRVESGETVTMVRVNDSPISAMLPLDGASTSQVGRFEQFYRMRPVKENAEATRPPASVIAAFNDAAHSPAIVERPFGAGRVLLFASTADVDWNTWARAADGSYVVTMLEILQTLARRDRSPGAFVAGQELNYQISPDEHNSEATFRPPNYPTEPAAPARTSGASAGIGEPIELRGPRATALGVYELELTHVSGGGETRPLCVNVDPTESDHAVATQAELDTAAGALRHDYLVASAAFLSHDEQARHELWRPVLIALVATLMFEQFLAWWFGRPRAAVAPVAIRSGGARPIATEGSV